MCSCPYCVILLSEYILHERRNSIYTHSGLYGPIPDSRPKITLHRRHDACWWTSRKHTRCYFYLRCDAMLGIKYGILSAVKIFSYTVTKTFFFHQHIVLRLCFPPMLWAGNLQRDNFCKNHALSYHILIIILGIMAEILRNAISEEWIWWFVKCFSSFRPVCHSYSSFNISKISL